MYFDKFICIGTGLALASGCSVLPKTVEKKPNVVLFLVDDLGWNDTSLPMAGEATKYNQRYRTPNLEKLAREGMTFTNAYSQALCVPSRASLMTGQNTMDCKVIGDYVATFNRRTKMEFPPGPILDKNGPTLPRLLKENGYRTIHTGKYHLAEYESKKPSPIDIGFDVNIAGSQRGRPGSYYGQKNFGSGGFQVPGLEKYHGKDIYLTDALTHDALVEVEKSVKEDKPFFLYVAHYAVHTPIQPDQKYRSSYQIDKNESVKEGDYASMVEGVDASLGAITTKLKELNIDDNTVVIFYSDNGGRVLWRGRETLYGKNARFNYPLRSGKASLYEGGIRVPAVIKVPQKGKKGVTSTAPVMIEDLYSTIVSLTGSDQSVKVQGRDLSPVIFNNSSESLNDRELYFHLPYRFSGADGVAPSSAVIKEGWKLIYFHKEERFELYNLNKDIGENNNLFTTYKAKAKEMVELLDKKMRGSNVIRPLFLPERRAVKWPLKALDK